jgi:hypothetical protein
MHLANVMVNPARKYIVTTKYSLDQAWQNIKIIV